jgi:transposase-like protein
MTPMARRVELVEAWRRSGLTQAALARREGLRYPTFAGWVQTLRTPAASAAPAVRFAELRLPSLASAPMSETNVAALEVRLPDGTSVRGGEVAAVAALVQALRRS